MNKTQLRKKLIEELEKEDLIPRVKQVKNQKDFDKLKDAVKKPIDDIKIYQQGSKKLKKGDSAKKYFSTKDDSLPKEIDNKIQKSLNKDIGLDDSDADEIPDSELLNKDGNFEVSSRSDVDSDVSNDLVLRFKTDKTKEQKDFEKEMKKYKDQAEKGDKYWDVDESIELY